MLSRYFFTFLYNCFGIDLYILCTGVMCFKFFPKFKSFSQPISLSFFENQSQFLRNKVSTKGFWSCVIYERSAMGNPWSFAITGLVSVIVTLLLCVILMEIFLLSVFSGIVADNWFNVLVTQLGFKIIEFSVRFLTGIWFAFPLLNFKICLQKC